MKHDQGHKQFKVADDNDLVLLLDYEKAAKALCLSKQALKDLVYKGRGPVATKLGRRTFFAVEDLKKFVAEHRDGPTE